MRYIILLCHCYCHSEQLIMSSCGWKAPYVDFIGLHLTDKEANFRLFRQRSKVVPTMWSSNIASRYRTEWLLRLFQYVSIIICPIAIAYSMGQIIKSVCVCLSVCVSVSVSVRLQALSRSHFLIDFHQNWHKRKNPQKEERVRWGVNIAPPLPLFCPTKPPF